MIRQQADELVHGFVCFVEKFFVSFGEGCVAAVVFRFIPSAFENFCQGGSDGVIAFLRGVEGESCEGTIGAHLGVVDSGGLWSFCLGGGGIGEEKREDQRREKKRNKIPNRDTHGTTCHKPRFLLFFASCERSDKGARREAGDP